MLAAAPAAACVGALVAEVPLRVVEGFPIVPGSVGGRAVSWLLDTGAQGHLVVPAAAVGLRADGTTTQMLGTGGVRQVANVMLDRLTIGVAALPGRSTPVADLRGLPRTDPPVAGLLGAPLLAQYDLDIDARRGRLGLHAPAGCAMPAAFDPVPVEVGPGGDVFVTVRVNGVALTALLDTGARATILSDGAARRLGVAAAQSANLSRGVDGTAQPIGHARVGTLQVGADMKTGVAVSVAALQLGVGEMLLGFDQVAVRRVWLSVRGRRAGFSRQ